MVEPLKYFISILLFSSGFAALFLWRDLRNRVSPRQPKFPINVDEVTNWALQDLVNGQELAPEDCNFDIEAECAHALWSINSVTYSDACVYYYHEPGHVSYRVIDMYDEDYLDFYYAWSDALYTLLGSRKTEGFALKNRNIKSQFEPLIYKP